MNGHLGFCRRKPLSQQNWAFRRRKSLSQLTSQLRNWSYCSAEWRSCAKNWVRNCETPFRMEISLRKWGFFYALVVRRPLRSCEMGAPVLRSGTRVPFLDSQLRKLSQRIEKCCELISQQKAVFAEKSSLAAKSRRALFLPCFCSVFALISSRFLPLHFLPPGVIQKDEITYKHTI